VRKIQNISVTGKLGSGGTGTGKNRRIGVKGSTREILWQKGEKKEKGKHPSPCSKETKRKKPTVFFEIVNLFDGKRKKIRGTSEKMGERDPASVGKQEKKGRKGEGSSSQDEPKKKGGLWGGGCATNEVGIQEKTSDKSAWGKHQLRSPAGKKENAQKKQKYL